MPSIKFTRADEIDLEAEKFHRDNPEIMQMFFNAALNRIAIGFQHYSINAIAEHVRWEYATRHQRPLEFKINNNFRQWYARKFHERYPEHDGFFRTRHRKSEDQPALGLPPLTPADFPYNNQPPIDSLLQ